jgi:hypothetical protein
MATLTNGDRTMNTLKIYHGATKPMVARGKHQCNLLAFAEKYKGWHSFADDRTTKRAVEALKAKGYLEVIGDQFRLTYPQA